MHNVLRGCPLECQARDSRVLTSERTSASQHAIHPQSPRRQCPHDRRERSCSAFGRRVSISDQHMVLVMVQSFVLCCVPPRQTLTHPFQREGTISLHAGHTRSLDVC